MRNLTSIKVAEDDLPSEIDRSLHVVDRPQVAKHSKALGPQVGLRLSRLMKVRELTDRALADKAQISFTTIQNLRRGFGGQAGIGTIFNVAKALNVAPEWLAFGAGPVPDDLINK